jgi:hypothetical protein
MVAEAWNSHAVAQLRPPEVKLVVSGRGWAIDAQMRKSKAVAVLLQGER